MIRRMGLVARTGVVLRETVADTAARLGLPAGTDPKDFGYEDGSIRSFPPEMVMEEGKIEVSLLPKHVRDKLKTNEKISMHKISPSDLDRVMYAEQDAAARIVVEKVTEKASGRVIGIDLGTTNSCISYIDPETQKPKIIPSPTGSWVFPTAVTFDKNHAVRVFGEEARAAARTSASATLCSGKRLIGRRFGELSQVQSQMGKTNILTVTESGEIGVEIVGRTYSVVHITAMFLRYLKLEAEKYLKAPVDQVVVSVPAYFTVSQKVATEDAALCAGFDVLEIIDEPSAACLAFTVLNKEEDSKAKRFHRSLVFDLGGGTLDCALMEHDTQKNSFALVATHGDPMLGGNDWDSIIAKKFSSEFERKWKVTIEDPEGNVAQGSGDYRQLMYEAEKAKIHFTSSTEVFRGYSRNFHFSEKLRDVLPLEATISYDEYLDLTSHLRQRCTRCLDQLFSHNNIDPKSVDNILLVGAMTRDPPVKRELEKYFGKSVAAEVTCPADYAVAIGAAVRGGMLQGQFKHLSRNTSFVSGTSQSKRSGTLVSRAWERFRSTLPGQKSANPNAIGMRWRGRAKGLSDDDIATFAKELVEFQAIRERRLLLEEVEDAANAVMRRVASDSSKRQGIQEKSIKQLSDQLKFWQYMVHNFHEHEEHLMRVTKHLEMIMDEYDGKVSDNTEVHDSEGKIDFGNMPVSRMGNKKAKVMRREVPLPTESSESAKIVERGLPGLMEQSEVYMSESMRDQMFRQTVEDRAYREPPAPPEEKGSWGEVKAAMDAGKPIGNVLSAEELSEPMTAEEQLEYLMHHFPIDNPMSQQQADAQQVSRDLATMIVADVKSPS